MFSIIVETSLVKSNNDFLLKIPLHNKTATTRLHSDYTFLQKCSQISACLQSDNFCMRGTEVK